MREWLVGLVGEEMAQFATYVISAAIVLVLLLLVVWIARKALGGSIGPRTKGRGPRLAVMDVAAIDPKRKLVLVRRDEVEHLLLIGGQNDVVVEASILRVPASARAQRTEPTMRPNELDPATDRQPPSPLPVASAPASAPAALQPPSKAATPLMPPQRLPAVAGQRPPEAKPASPLARSVPRPPMPTPAQQAPEPQQIASPATAVVRQPSEPDDMRPATAGAAAERQMPVAASRPAPAPAVEAAAMPPRPEPQFPPMRDPVEASEPAGAERLSSESDASTSEGTILVATAPPVMSQQREQDLGRESSDAPRVQSPAADAAPQSQAPAAAPRIELERRKPSTGEGDRLDPVVERPAAPLRSPERRPTPQQTVQPIQPRSMATPTYRSASPFLGLGEDGGRTLPQPVDPQLRDETRIDARQESTSIDPTPSRAMPSPMAAPNAPVPSAEPAQQLPIPPLPAPAGNASLSGLLGLRPTAPSSPIIAAAERQRDALRPRPAPSIEVPPPVEPAGLPGDAAEKRPLSVRSFATSIQSMKPSAETAPVPTQPAVPSQSAPPLGPQRREPELKPPLPAFVAPPVAAGAAASAAAVAPTVASTSTTPGVADPGASLDDFLSAELDSDFGSVSWEDEPAVAKAPDVRVEPPTPETRNEPPRALTLEEEMERLLGDFDFDTSDRRAQ